MLVQFLCIGLGIWQESTPEKQKKKPWGPVSVHFQNLRVYVYQIFMANGVCQAEPSATQTAGSLQNSLTAAEDNKLPYGDRDTGRLSLPFCKPRVQIGLDTTVTLETTVEIGHSLNWIKREGINKTAKCIAWPRVYIP
ncbi:uncharacterized protein LOC144311481 [Canis aureus]